MNADAMLPADDLDRLAIRHWHAGARQDLSAADFWRLVQLHLDRLEAGPRPDGITLVLGHTSPDQMALFVALIASGRLAALFPPNTPLQDEGAYFTQQRGSFAKIDPARIFILEERLAETIRRIDPAFGARTELAAPMAAHVPQGVDPHAALERFRARLASDTPIFVQHSSGTTGIKKAVAITGQALAAQYRAYWPGLRAACGKQHLAIASWLPLYHDMGLISSLLLPLLGGDTVSITDAFEWIAKPGLLFDMIEQDRCDIAWMPNFAFRHLVRLAGGMEKRALDGMRLWIDCSEPCRFADAAAFEQAFEPWGVRPGSVVGCYAMAETVFAVSQCLPGEQRALSVPSAVQPGSDLSGAGARVVERTDAVSTVERLVLSSGRILPDLEVAIVADGETSADWAYGEIAVRGLCLFGGYRGMSRAESSLAEDGFFRTGDLGTIVDGHLYVFGRLKEIIIVNGKNLFAGDIEDALAAVPGIRRGRVVAFGLDNPQTGSEELVVVAEADPAAAIAPAQARQDMSRVISEEFLIKPRDVRVVEERWLVKSTSGKISREDNRAKYVASFRATAAAPARERPGALPLDPAGA